MFVLTGVVTDVKDHGAVNAEEQHGRAPERQPPRALHGEQTARQLIAVALYRAVEHVDQGRENKGAADVLQPLDALKTHHRQPNLQELEGDKEEHQVVETEQGCGHHIQRAGTDPALKAIPDDGRHRAHQAGQARAAEAKSAARLHHKGDAVFVTGGAIEHQRDTDNETADGDGQRGLNQVEAADHTGAHSKGADGDAAAEPGQQVGQSPHNAGFLRGE